MIFSSLLARHQRGTFAALAMVSLYAAEALASSSFQGIMNDVLRGVVHISSPERPLQPDGFMSPYQYLFQSPIPQGAQSYPLGSGFLVNPRGSCVTSFRALEGASRFDVTTADKRRWKARLVGGDRALDLALLKIEGEAPAVALDFGASEKLTLGDPLMAIGQPLGFQPFVTEGRLAAKGNVLGSGAHNRFLVLDLQTHPANAGGPLVDSRGRVVGMASYLAKAPPSLGFGLPSHLLAPAIRDMLRHGKIVKPWLGVVARNVPNLDSMGEVYGAGQRSALIVDNLIIDGPAAKAGLQVGDLIVAQAGKELGNLSDLQDVLASKKAGDPLKLKVFRRKQGYVTIEISLGEIPSAVDLPDTEDLL